MLDVGPHPVAEGLITTNTDEVEMNNHLALVLIAALFVCTARGQETAETSPNAGAGAVGDPVSLTVVVTPDRKGRLSRRKVVLVVANHTPAPLVLDRRFLFEGVMVQLWDRNKEAVGKLPVSPPRPPAVEDRVIVAPGAEYKARFELGDLYEADIIDSLNTGPYTIQFCYRNSVPGALDGIPFSLLEICSEPQTLP